MSVSSEWFEEAIKETAKSKTLDLDGIRINYLVWGGERVNLAYF